MAEHLRTGGNAMLDRVQHQVHVEPGLLGDRKPLRKAGDLDCAEQIVDQLVNRAAAYRAEMPDRGAERREIWPRPLQIGWLGADQQGQLSRRRRVRQAGDWTVDVNETAASQLARKIERMLMGNG